MLWFGPDVAYTTCFSPFPSKVLQLPHAYQIGDPQKFSRSAAWWAFDFVANWARLNFQRMCQVDIVPLQQELETRQAQQLVAWDQRFREGGSAQELTTLCEQNATHVLACWWELADSLIARYSDGYINSPVSRPQNGVPVAIGYPSHWLGVSDYRNGPVSYDMKL